MDPFTALGVAGNIVQFVDFTVKLISKGREIYQSIEETSAEYLDLQAIATNISRLNGRLQEDLHQHLVSPTTGDCLRNRSLGRAERELGAINKKCAEEAGSLLSALRNLRVEGKHKMWNSFRQALLSVWHEDEINGIQNRLSEYRRALDTELLFCLRTTVDALSQQQLEHFSDLDQKTVNIEKGLDRMRQESRINHRKF